MVVEANSVVYDDKAHSVTAEGDAQIYNQGKILEADRVTYFKDTGRVLAEGSVKLTDSDGTVTHADRMELTGDFKQGFVDSVRADTKEKTHFSATRSEKIDADTTVFHKGTYTACPSCAEHPERAPLWRLRARRVVHKNNEQMLYYEGATFELYGLPIAYLPFLSMADPSVTRQSGFLAPKISLPVHHRLWLRHALFLGHRAEHGYDHHAQLPVEAGLPRRDSNSVTGWKTAITTSRRPASISRTTSVFAAQPWGSGNQTNRGEVTVARRDLAEPELEIRLGRRPRLGQMVPERLRPAQSGSERQFLPRDLLDRLSERPGRPRLFRPARLLLPGHGEFRLPAAARRRLADAGTTTRPSISLPKRPMGSAARSPSTPI